MNRLLFGLGVVALAVIGAVAATSVTWVFWEAWKGTDRDAFRALLGGFSGALFAFLFVRFGEGLKRIYDRKEKHHTSLVRLQHHFNDCLNITGDNIFVIDDFLRTFDEKSVQPGEVRIYINRFQQYPIDRELVIWLANIEFANQLYTFNAELAKLNDSLATLDRSYEKIVDAFLSKDIELSAYLANIRHSRGRYIQIREYLLEAKSDLIRLFATVKLLSLDAPFLMRIIRALAKSRYPRRFSERLDAEIKTVTADIEAGAQRSAQRIRQVEARAAQPSAEL